MSYLTRFFATSNEIDHMANWKDDAPVSEFWEAWGNAAQEATDLIAERNELLAACQKARSWIGERPSDADQRWPYGKSVTEVIDALDAAIATAMAGTAVGVGR